MICKRCVADPESKRYTCDRKVGDGGAACGRLMCFHLKGKRDDGDVCGPCMLAEGRAKKTQPEQP